MQFIETTQMVETGSERSNNNSIKLPPSWKMLWKDNAQKILQERNVVIQNRNSMELAKKTIMEFAQDHAESDPKSKDLISKTNHARFWKISVLPCEISVLHGTKMLILD